MNSFNFIVSSTSTCGEKSALQLKTKNTLQWYYNLEKYFQLIFNYTYIIQLNCYNYNTILLLISNNSPYLLQ
ncbi:hypothetical protein [Spiroplasma endosymbiont of Virgichneumon dumeticola]|uniref:hypothetical protein n=1 Tax=Spiroplasma endosymbiont of Virgichneumon dumeticola TaxID=3139323 RepID=UPI0035C8A848